MTIKSTTKGLVTKLKNRIINALHETDIPTLIKISKILGIKVSPDLENLNKEEKEKTPD